MKGSFIHSSIHIFIISLVRAFIDLETVIQTFIPESNCCTRYMLNRNNMFVNKDVLIMSKTSYSFLLLFRYQLPENKHPI